MKKGFTLVELLISVALLGIILVAVSAIFSVAIKNYRTQSQQSFMQKELNFAADNISKDIKMANEVPQTYDTFTLSSNTLILALPAENVSDNFIYGAGGLEKDYVVYYLENNSLFKRVFANPQGTKTSATTRILTDVSSVTFEFLPDNISARSVSLKITLSRVIGKTNVTTAAERRANLRNKR